MSLVVVRKYLNYRSFQITADIRHGNIFTCSFEEPCSALLQSDTDDFNWTRQSGDTPSEGTGPSFDHTFRNTTGKITDNYSKYYFKDWRRVELLNNGFGQAFYHFCAPLDPGLDRDTWPSSIFPVLHLRIIVGAAVLYLLHLGVEIF